MRIEAQGIDVLHFHFIERDISFGKAKLFI
jgi:hypothetical protein